MGSKSFATGLRPWILAATFTALAGIGVGAAHAEAAPPAATAPAGNAPATAAAPADSGNGQPGVWREHEAEFAYMGFTSRYSCDGLESKLKLLLRQLGARSDAKVTSYACANGFGRPDRFPAAKLKFATLAPADAAPGGAGTAGPTGAAPAAPSTEGAPVMGAWRTVQIAPHRPFDLQDGDCELIEQFRDKLLPLFSTRDTQVRTNCIPHQDTGGPFSMQLQVFAPLGRTASK